MLNLGRSVALISVFLFVVGDSGFALDESRSGLAESGRQLRLRTPVSRVASQALADAMDISSSMLLESTFDGDGAAAGVFSKLGRLRPRVGDDMVLISTGVAGSRELNRSGIPERFSIGLLPLPASQLGVPGIP